MNDMHLPSKLTMYRGITMLSSLLAPVLLGFVLQWQSGVTATIAQQSRDIAALQASVQQSTANLRERVIAVETVQRARALAGYDASDAQRDRDIVDERLDFIRDKVESNSEDIDEMVMLLDDVCDAIEGCSH